MTIFFDGWAGIVRILVAAPLIYVAIVGFIRLSGKRSTSQMNNFDWIVTVALGSIVGSGILLEGVTVLEALFAIGLLLALQYVLTSVIPHSEAARDIAKADPRLLVSQGKFIEQAMRDERVTRGEIQAALRQNGLTDVREAHWVILETDASLSVVPEDGRNFREADLEGVTGFQKHGRAQAEAQAQGTAATPAPPN